MSSILDRKVDLRVKLNKSQQQLSTLEQQLREFDVQLMERLQEKPRYEALREVISSLDRLAELGGARLFWGESSHEEDARLHQNRLHDQLISFENLLEELRQGRQEVWVGIEARKDEIHEYNLLNQHLLDKEEEALHEFIIDREDEGVLYRPAVMPWSIHGKDEKRYRKILALVVLFTLLMSFVIPRWEFPEVPKQAKIEIPERLAKLVLKKKPPPPPPPPSKEEEKKEDKPKKDEKKKKEKEKVKKPEPTKKEVAVARKKAESSGVLAFKSNFAGLLDLDNELDSKLGANAQLTNLGATAKKSSRSIITTSATSGSGGIQTAALSKNVGGTGNTIEGVGFSRVESSIGSGEESGDRPLSDGPGPSRTDEEIQIVFDRYKSALYRIYNRELRKNPTLQGKMVLRLTIEADGKVSACRVDSSDMDSPEMDRKMVARVKKFNFGVKDGVSSITILFPIDFLPAN